MRARRIFILSSLSLILINASLLANEVPAVPEAINLETAWLFQVGDDPAWAAPDFDDSSWKALRLPARNFVNGASRGWYWLRLHLNLNAGQIRERSLIIGEIMNHDQAWINGVLIGSTGSAPPNFRSGWDQLRDYPVADGILTAGSNTIALRVYFDTENWINGPILLDDQFVAGRLKMWSDFLKIGFMEMLFGILFFISGIFLFYFFKRLHEREYLYFSLSVLFLDFSLAATFFDQHFPFSVVSANQILAFSQASLILFPPFLALFMRQYMGKDCSWRCVLAHIGLPVVAAVAIMVCSADRSLFMSIRTPMLASIPVFLVLCLVTLIQGIRQNPKRSWAFLIAFVPVIIMAVHDLLAFGLGILSDNVATFVYAMPVLVILFTLRFVSLAVNTQSHNDTLQHLLDEAQIDSLSGLYTRGSFEKLMKLAFNHAERYGEFLVVAIIDIDGLKQVNDCYGHSVGDELIRNVARQLDLSRRKTDLLSRYGGDEFVGLYFSGQKSAIAANLEATLRELAAYPIVLGERHVIPRFSYGLAAFPGDASDMAGLLEQADHALYAMKAEHKKVSGQACE